MSSEITNRKPPVLVLGSGRQLTVLEPGSSHTFAEERKVDICFVFDTTGSMSNKIDGLVECMVGFVRELAQLALDWRLSVVPFGDLTVPGDRIVADLPFVCDRAAAERLLREMPRNSGGANDGESVLEAIQAALAKPYRQGAVKVFIVLTDEPALEGQLTRGRIEKDLIRYEVIAFVVSPPYGYYRHWAERSGGEWFEIGPQLHYSSILCLLRGLVQRVALVAAEVHTLAGGSVARYRALPSSARTASLSSRS